jgi:hypothetical protein
MSIEPHKGIGMPPKGDRRLADSINELDDIEEKRQEAFPDQIDFIG